MMRKRRHGSTAMSPVAATQPMMGGKAPAAPPITMFCGVDRLSHRLSALRPRLRARQKSRRRGEIFAVLEVSGGMRSTDGGESWSDCSADPFRRAEPEPGLRSKLVSDTEAEGMLDGHAVCTSSADPDSIIIAVRMGLFRSKDQGKTWQDMRVDRFSPFAYGRDIKV